MKKLPAFALFALCWISACRPNDEPQQPQTPTQTCKLTAMGALYPVLDFESPNFNGRFSQAYEYDAQGKLLRLFINNRSDTAKRLSLTIERDAQGRMAKVTSRDQGLVGSYFAFGYDGTASSPVSSKLFIVSYPSGESSLLHQTNFEYNASKKVVQFSNQPNNCNCRFGYEYDSRGNPTRFKLNPGQVGESVLIEFKSFDDKTNPLSLNEDVQMLNLLLHRVPPMTNNPTSWVAPNSSRPTNGKGFQVDVVYTYNAAGQPITFKGTGTNLGSPDQKITSDEQSISYTCK